MKKIVFVSGRLGGGGSERVLTLIANALRSLGYNVTILTFFYNELELNNYNNQCKVVSIEYSNKIDQIIKIRKEIKAINPDVVIAFEYYIAIKVIFACLGLSTRTIVSERNNPHMIDHMHLKKILRDYSYKKADILVCQTDDAKNYFYKKGIKNIKVIPNPIKDNLPVWNHHANKSIINYCRLEEQKNLQLLIKSFAEVHKEFPDFSLNIYGEGSLKDELEILIHKLSLENCVYINPFTKDIHKIVSNSYMFVSSSNFEGLSNSLLESLAIGIPVITTDCPIGGAKMVIEDGVNGLLTEVGNKEMMVRKIKQLILNNDYAINLSKNELKIREKLSLKEVTNMWIDIL